MNKTRVRISLNNNRKVNSNMKIKNIFVLSILIIVLSSCSVTNYYTQVVQTQPVSDSNLEVDDKGCYLYQDDNCIITCDLWAEGGRTHFYIHNTSDEVITIYPNECTISINRRSYMMFDHTNIIVVAPHSYTSFSGIYLGYERLVDCDFNQFPQVGFPSTMSFSMATSPYVYNFYLTYKMGLSGQKHAAKMDFYISRVSNYVPKDIIVRNQKRQIKTEYCENVPNSKNATITEYYDQYLFSPGTGFYVKYSATKTR